MQYSTIKSDPSFRSPYASPRSETKARFSVPPILKRKISFFLVACRQLTKINNKYIVQFNQLICGEIKINASNSLNLA